MSLAAKQAKVTAAVLAAAVWAVPGFAQQSQQWTPVPQEQRRLHLADLDSATQLQLQTMQNAIRYLQIQAQQITQIKEALTQAQQNDKEQAALIEQRFNKVDNALASSRLLELVSQVETLNTELNRLRGEVETLRNALVTAEKRERERYAELDERLKRAEQAGAASAGSSAETASSATAAAEAAAAASASSTAPAAASAASATASAASATEASPSAGGASVPVIIAVTPASSAAANPAAASATISGAAKPPVRDPVAENKLYDEALRQFRAGNYPGAIASFQSFTEKYPASALAPNAQYWTGVSYFNQRDFAKALQSNQVLLKQYPESSKVPDAMLNMASIHVEQNEHAAARAVLDEIIAKFPDSDAAAKARTRLTLLKK